MPTVHEFALEVSKRLEADARGNLWNPLTELANN